MTNEELQSEAGVSTCEYCGKHFTPPERGRPPKYCSDSHKVRAFRKRQQSIVREGEPTQDTMTL